MTECTSVSQLDNYKRPTIATSMKSPLQKKRSSMLWEMASDLSGSDDGLLEAEYRQPPATTQPIMERTSTKTVRFPDDGSPELQRHILIPSLSESTPEELSDLYTTERDHQRAMLDARDCILFVRRRQYLQQQLASTAVAPAQPFVFDQAQEDATGYCLRGLESMQSKSILELSALRKRLVRETVLLEQKRSKEDQTGNDNNDHLRKPSLEERVAAASAEASSWARDRAYERAAADAAWVQQHVLLEETLAAALNVHEEPPPNESQEALIKKRRRRSSVTFCPTTRLSTSSFCSTTSGADDDNDPKGLAQSFRRLSCKGSSAPGFQAQVPTSPRTYAYRPTKKTTITTNARITSSPSA